MAKSNQDQGPEARLPKGFRDSEADEIRALGRMLATIREVYESYGFEPLETPAIEYTDALGKFLPDQDRPNEGVFSFTDEDGRWLSLRYDLTAPLARYVAENFDKLPKPFRRYAWGPVWRNEKPGPGRFRQFMQFDADTVGTNSVAADAEICMLAADTMEKLGIPRGQYVIRVSNRKVLDGLMEAVGLSGDENNARRLVVLRAIDKLDRLGVAGVAALLGSGRKDASGDFTPGAQLNTDQIAILLQFLGPDAVTTTIPSSAASLCDNPALKDMKGGILLSSMQVPDGSNFSLGTIPAFIEGLSELNELRRFVEAAGYGPDRIRIDQTVVRGLEYYTGPVFEAELTFPVTNEDGETVRFGSVGGGGRYDDLVARFTGQSVPATGFSIGVSRLQAAVAELGKSRAVAAAGPVVVTVLDKDRVAEYQRIAQELRAAGIRAEMYLGSAGLKAQMRYADKRGSPCVVIQGSDERAKGEVQIKDLIEGAKLSATISDAKTWREGRPAQFSVPETDLVSAVKSVLARHAR
jgi:histidyl-tRNA synthetase